nr:MAG TPA: Portal [Caudoviricetes sp.]
MAEEKVFTGRTVISTNAKSITRENLLTVLTQAKMSHSKNKSEIEYLFNYYKGKQPILTRKKEVRPDICNTVVVNRANEIVAFKTGYLCGEPIQYINRNGEDSVTENINTLNEYMFSEDKASQDEEIVEWGNICGTAYRLVLPDDRGEIDEAPFEMYTLDPRYAFVVYSNGIGKKPLMGVIESKDENNVTHYSIYTEDKYFHVLESSIVEETPHILGMIPIFEYPANNARLGAFEIVLPLLDAINNVESNRLDGVEQIVQAFIKFINCDITKDEYEAFLEMGAIKVKSVDGAPADVGVVTTELNQDQTQTLSENLYNTVLTICGMPNRNGGNSTSDTGSAVLLRDGWSLAEARAKDSEHIFKRAEKQMLKLVLKICNTSGELALKLSDISLKFTRRNYENIQSKSQVLISMLQQEKIHPLLAFSSSGLFIDPEEAYTLSMKYYEEQQKLAEKPDKTQNTERTDQTQEGIENGKD